MKNLEDFLYKYISYDSNNEEYAVDSLFDFVYLDKKSVDKDINEIRYFITNNFNLKGKLSSIYCLLINNNGEIINNLITLNDLRILNNLYALAIQSGIINNSLILRLYNYESLKDYFEYFDMNNFDLSCDCVKEDFLFQLRLQILPKYVVDLNQELINRYKEKDITNSKYAEVLRFWWSKNEGLNEEDNIKFENLIKTNMSNLLIYMTYGYANGENYKDILNEIRNNNEYNTMKSIDEYYQILSESEKNTFNEKMKRIIRSLALELMVNTKVTKIKKP